MKTTTSSPLEGKRSHTPLERLLINRNYAYNWIGLTFSQLGNVVFTVALILWVGTTLARNAPWAAFALGGLVFLPTVVLLVVNIFAGVYVDRWDARRTQLFMDAGRAVLFTLLILATGVVPLPFPIGSEAANLFQLACVYVAVILSKACDPFVNSALAVILYDIVDEENLPRAFGRGQVLNIIATIAGPPLAALIFFTLGIQWAILLNVLSFVISFFAFYMVRLPRKEEAVQQKGEAEPGQKSSFGGEFLEGIRFTFGSRLLVAVIVALMLVTAGTAGIETFDLYFATNNLHAPPQFYAYLDLFVGAGALLGALLAGPWMRTRIGQVRAYWISVLAYGLLLLVFARMTSIVAGLVVVFLLGIAQAISSVAFGPIFFKATPRAMMGRVNSVLMQLLTIVALLSLSVIPALISGPLRNKFLQVGGMLFGPIDTLYMAVAILVITGALYLRVALNEHAEDLNRPTTEEEGKEAEEISLQLSSLAKRGRLSTLQKQVGICVVGVVAAVLVILPAALTAPTNVISNLQLSRGQPARGQPVDNLLCSRTPGSAELANTRLTIYVNGQQAGIPVGIGSVAPPQPGVAALASNGQTTCLYPLNVPEVGNIIHVASSTNHTYTLGEFFDIWGQPLSRSQVADYTSAPGRALAFYVFDADENMHTYAGNPRAIPLLEHETIVIVYNSPHAQLMPYNSWNGL